MAEHRGAPTRTFGIKESVNPKLSALDLGQDASIESAQQLPQP